MIAKEVNWEEEDRRLRAWFNFIMILGGLFSLGIIVFAILAVIYYGIN